MMNLTVIGLVVRGEHAAWRCCDLCQRLDQPLSECVVLGALWYDLCPHCLEATAAAPEPASRAAWDRWVSGVREAAPPVRKREDLPPLTGGQPQRINALHKEYRQREKTLVLVVLGGTGTPESCEECGVVRRLYHCHFWRLRRLRALCKACALHAAGGEAGVHLKAVKTAWRNERLK